MRHLRALPAGDGAAGASGFLLKDVTPAAPNVAGALADLTAREREVLVLMARGLSNAELAEQLIVSEATVKTHVARILGKFGRCDRVQAVVLAYETGLVTPGEA